MNWRGLGQQLHEDLQLSQASEQALGRLTESTQLLPESM